MKKRVLDYSVLNSTSNFNIFESDFDSFDDSLPSYIKEPIIEDIHNTNYDSEEVPSDFIGLDMSKSLFDIIFVR